MYNTVEIAVIITFDILMIGVGLLFLSLFDKFIKKGVEDEEEGELSPFWEKVIKVTPFITFLTYIGFAIIGYLITADTLADSSLTAKETFEKLNVLYTALVLITLIHVKNTGNPFRELIKQEG